MGPTRGAAIRKAEHHLLTISRALSPHPADLGVDDEHPIPLPTVSGAILEKVIDYCTHHKVCRILPIPGRFRTELQLESPPLPCPLPPPVPRPNLHHCAISGSLYTW